MTAENDAPRDLVDGRIRPINMEAMIKRIKARIRHGNINVDQKALVFEGEAGCGKTSIVLQTLEDELNLKPFKVCLGAQQVEELLAAGIKVGEDENGNPKIIQAVHENLIPRPHHVTSGDWTFEVNGKERTVIPWVFDEIFTGNMAQMNQLRAALTLNQIGSIDVPKEACIIGTTNPEDVVYSSRKSVDGAVMDRCEIVRVYMTFEHHQRYLAKQEAKGEFPAVCRLFLRMDENRDIWGKASPRFWHQGFGLVWQELSGELDYEDPDLMLLFSQALSGHFQEIAKRNKQRRSKEKLSMTADALIARFMNFIEHGDDPHYYPISGNAVLKGGEEKKIGKSQLDLFDWWHKNNGQSFIGVTVQDMSTVICQEDDITTKQANHISDLLGKSGSGLSVQFFRELYNTKRNTPVYEKIYGALKGTKAFTDIAEAMQQNDRMVKELKENRIRQKQMQEEL
jgi:hypothetical protein